jgi:hypothetical protein
LALYRRLGDTFAILSGIWIKWSSGIVCSSFSLDLARYHTIHCLQ